MGTWNQDWSAASGTDFLDRTSGGAVASFAAARDERVKAQDVFGTSGTTMPSVGDIALSVGFSGTDKLWGSFVPNNAAPSGGFFWQGSHGSGIIPSIADHYVLKHNDDGTDYTPEATAGINALTNQISAGALSAKRFPKNGWTRKFERSIYDLSAAGIAGQRARYLHMTGLDTWYLSLSSAGDFNTTPTSPAGDDDLSGRFVEYSGSAWVRSADQTIDADVVTETGVDYRWPGDIFDGTALNEMRDALNEMTRTAGPEGVNGVISLSTKFAPYAAGGPGWDSGTAGNDAYRTVSDNTSGNPSATNASVDALYDAAASSSGFFGGHDPFAYKRIQASGPPYVANSWQIVRQKNSILASGPNAQTKHRLVSWWNWGRAANGGSGTFDAYGDDVLSSQWHQFGTPVDDATAGTVNGPTLGTVSGGHPSPWPTVVGSSQYQGWELLATAVIMEWETTGGFDFTASTP